MFQIGIFHLEIFQILNVLFNNLCPTLGDWDSQYECHDIDEDKLIDDLEDTMAEGNVIIEHHVTDIFPERWFDCVFVLRTENTQLFDRLKTRQYNEKKLEDNVQCEIFQMLLKHRDINKVINR